MNYKVRGYLGLLAIVARFYPRIRYLSYYQKTLNKTGMPPDPNKTKKEADKLFKALIKSGPIFIKFGQLLSSRRDLLPEEYMESLSNLQDKVPFPDFREVEEVIKAEIGDINKVFEQFYSEGLSGASLGLVYKAIYKGKPVAVKVHRPNIEKIIERDKPKIRLLINMLERNTGKSFALRPMMEEFLNSIYLELDYEREAESIDIIGSKLEELDLDFNVKVPQVYKEISTKRVLVMEYLDFIKITDLNSIRKEGLNPNLLAKNVDKMFLRLALRKGRFHADPHPGNIGVRKDGTIVLLDFGMTSEISEETRDRLILAYYYLSKLDADNLVETLTDMGIVDPLADRAIMVEAIKMALKSLEGKDITEIEYRELVRKADEILFRFPFRLPYNLTLFARMSVILEGVCKTLDPNFNFIATVSEIMEEEKAERKVFVRKIKDIPYKVFKTYNQMKQIPELVKSIYLNMNKKKDNRYQYAIISAGLFIGGSIFYGKGDNFWLFLIFIIAGISMGILSLT